jgi:hypothetical protein
MNIMEDVNGNEETQDKLSFKGNKERERERGSTQR